MFENVINEARSEIFELKKEGQACKELLKDMLKELIKIKSSVARIEKEKTK